MWGGRPRPPTLFADVLTTRDPTLVKRHDECSTSICHPESAPVHLVIPNPLQRCQYTRPCTLSFRIRFSGAIYAAPAHCHSESASAVRNLLFPPVVSRKRGVPRVSPLFRPGIPALIETDSYQGTPSGVPPRTHPAGPRPSGATATARSSAVPLIKARQRMTKEPLSRTPSSVV